MDENQMQNHNMSQMPPQPQPQPSGQSPVMGIPTGPKKTKMWFWVTIVVILAIGGLAYWYVSRIATEAPVVEQTQLDQQAREDAMISRDIQDSVSVDLDAEFQAVDKDINSL